MNVAIAKIFETVNLISKFKIQCEEDSSAIRESLNILIRVIEPMIPHVAEECWGLNNSNSLSEEPWPKVNQKYLENNEVTIVIQINGKRRGEVLVSRNASEKEVNLELSKIKNINDALTGKNILKSIYVPNKILNIVLDK